MFYEESMIASVLKCQHCNQKYDRYDQPRIIPCGKTICNNCVIKIQNKSTSNRFKCEICTSEHYIPEQGFTINELAFNLMLLQPKEIYRSEQCETLKSNLKLLNDLVDELNFDMNNGVDKIKYHCNELRRLVQLATEERIQQIQNFNESFIIQINKYEKERVDDYATNDKFKQELEEVVNETNLFLDEKKVYLSQCQISEEEIRTSNEKALVLKSKIDNELRKTRIRIFNDILMEFEKNDTKLDEKLLGSINLKGINLNFTKIYSGSFDKTIKGYDLKTGENFKTLIGHGDNVLCLNMLSPTRLISGSGEGTFKIWNLETDECIKTVTAHTKRIRSIVVMSIDRIVSCSDDKTIKLWDLLSYICLRAIEGHSSEIYCMDKIASDKIVSCSNDKTIKLWDMNTGECIQTFLGHEGPIYSVQKLTNEKIVSASDDRTIRIWDINSGDYIKTLKGHTNWVWCIKVISSDQIISGSGDKTIKIWDLNTNQCVRTLTGHGGSVRCLHRISHDKIISCSDDKLIRIWNLNNGECVKSIRGHSDIVWCLELPK